jgi:hypothetical protein
MQDDYLTAVRPNGNWRTFSIAVGLQLLQAISTLGLFHLHNNESGIWVVVLANDDTAFLWLWYVPLRMPSTWTMTTSHSKADVTGNLYIADPSQKLPAASDNVQNHTQVTEVVELVSPSIRDIGIFRYEKRFCPVGLICLAS